MSEDITINIVLTDAMLSANDNEIIKELGAALGIDDPASQPRVILQDALINWVKKRIKAERSRGSELLLSERLTGNPLFPVE